MARPKAENPKAQTIALRVTDAQRAWLKEREDETGNDASSTIRSLIAQAMSPGRAPVPIVSQFDAEAERRAREAERKEAERQAKIAAKRRELEALERGEDIDDAPEMYDREPEADAAGEFDESELEEPEPGPAKPSPRGPAFSVTRPAGMREDMRSGNVMGDARGNIVRENFKFLGR